MRSHSPRSITSIQRDPNCPQATLDPSTLKAIGKHAANSMEHIEFMGAATELVAWLLSKGVTQTAACKAAGVSFNWLHYKHKVTGTSRAELLADWAALSGKVAQRARGERTGLPTVEQLPKYRCCQGDCGAAITATCYRFHWEAFSKAPSEEEANHVLARVRCLLLKHSLQLPSSPAPILSSSPSLPRS